MEDQTLTDQELRCQLYYVTIELVRHAVTLQHSES